MQPFTKRAQLVLVNARKAAVSLRNNYIGTEHLLLGILRIEHIQEKSDFLLSNMAFFFVPAGVSIINYLDLLKSSLVPLLVVCVVSTVITFAVTAWSIRLTMRLMNRRDRS